MEGKEKRMRNPVLEEKRGIESTVLNILQKRKLNSREKKFV
jgi:hypothetical protein